MVGFKVFAQRMKIQIFSTNKNFKNNVVKFKNFKTPVSSFRNSNKQIFFEFSRFVMHKKRKGMGKNKEGARVRNMERKTTTKNTKQRR